MQDSDTASEPSAIAQFPYILVSHLSLPCVPAFWCHESHHAAFMEHPSHQELPPADIDAAHSPAATRQPSRLGTEAAAGWESSSPSAGGGRKGERGHAVADCVGESFSSSSRGVWVGHAKGVGGSSVGTGWGSHRRRGPAVCRQVCASGAACICGVCCILSGIC